jgi:hypothetical protein
MQRTHHTCKRAASQTSTCVWRETLAESGADLSGLAMHPWVTTSAQEAYVNLYIYIYICIYTYIQKYMYIYTCAHMNIHKWKVTHLHHGMCAHTLTHTYMHTKV